ncbi:MAG: LamG domain-containing protein, partial [Planctomycetota bacterium]
MSKKLIYLASFALLLCVTVDVKAELTEVLNPSFEDDWNGWYHRTSYTYISAEGGNFPDTPYGGNWAELGNGSWFYQQIGTWEEDMQLQVSFLVGSRTNQPFQGVYVSLWVGGDPSSASNAGTKTPTTLESAVGATQIVISDLILPAIGAGETSEQVVEFSTGTGYTYGEPLWILVQAQAIKTRSCVDNVSVVRQGDWEPYPYSSEPDPVDGALIEATWVDLTWSPSSIAVSHDVYFGEDFDDVNDGTNVTFLGNQAESTVILGLIDYPYPDGLVPGTTYYWRIDEVNDDEPNSPWKGDVWNFTIPPRSAYDISPADGTKYIEPNVELNWMGGLGAILHHVYFGDNFDDVNDGAGDTYIGALPDPTYTPGELELEKTYFWRVDEFDNTSTLKGDVWSFTIEPFIPVTDPNLVCWWTLDEASGLRVLDLSGHGHHGTFQGSPEWADGYDGNALHFTSEGDYVVHSLGAASDWPAGTLTVWVKADSVGQDVWSSVFSSHTPSGAGFQIDTDGDNPGVYRITGGFIFGTVTTNWVHLAVSFDGTSAKLYYNGDWASSGTLTDTIFNQFALCTNRNVGNSLFGVIDDFRMYDKVLTQQEIQLVMRIDPLLAWDPSPANGSVPDIENAELLTWTAGDMATQHDVY